MKLQLIYDYFSNGKYNGEEECGVGYPDDDPGYCSDFHVNPKLPHEKTDYKEMMYRQIAKYCHGGARTDGKTLVEVPDEIMMQYMLEGVYDLDYLAYDYYEHQICISNSMWLSSRHGRNRNFGSVHSASPEDVVDNKFFTFNASNMSAHDEQNAPREDYSIIPDGDHYANIREALEPYITYKFVEWFKMGADIIYSTQTFPTPYDNGRYDMMWYEQDTDSGNVFRARRIFEDDECKSTQTWDMRYECFMLCMDFWQNDHKIFLDARRYLSDLDIDAYRVIDTRIKAKISETKQ